MQNAFTWHPATTILPTGRPQAVEQLRDLITQNASFAVSSAVLTQLPNAPEPELHCTTSGSSGQPKVIRRTQASWRHSFAINGTALNLTPQSCVATFGNFDTSLALYATCEAAHHGARVLPLHGMRPNRQHTALATHGATHLYLTPTQLQLLCSGAPLPHVQTLMIGGGTLHAPTLARAANTFPNANCIQFYGAAETSFITWTTPGTPSGSVGMPYPNVTLKIRDSAGLETKNAGEIWVKSPYLATGYVSGTSPDTVWENGFISVGELGQLDQSGNLYVLGRKNRMVTISDTNVFPETVETYLATLFPQAHIAVLAQPDPKRGHHLIAAIAGPNIPAIDTILRQCRAALGPLRTPRSLHIVREIPMLPAGKPDYESLRHMIGVPQ